jgi:hypothetical protein
MESAFAADFSAVRVHTGPASDRVASGLGARALTAGRDIVFGPGGFRPHTPGGDRLLAHELAHVVQQAGGLPRAAVDGGTADPLEKAAEKAADQAVTSGRVAGLGPTVSGSQAPAGGPLPGPLRARFETVFGTDLSEARLHDGPAGEGMAREHGARAVTVGSDVFFGTGALWPWAPSGDRLLAHELAHVVQQAEGIAAGREGASASAELLEREAAQAAVAFGAGGRLAGTVRGHAGSHADAGAAMPLRWDGTEPAADPVQAEIDAATKEIDSSVALIVRLAMATETGALEPHLSTIVRGAYHGRDPVAVQRATDVAAEIAGIRYDLALPGEGTATLPVPGVLRRLAQVHETDPGVAGYEASAGVRHAVNVTAGHIARAIASGLPDAAPSRAGEWVARVWSDLDQVARALADGTALLRLELEGTVAELVTLRKSFALSDDEGERAVLGEEIGRSARAALLLNGRLESVGAAGPTALDTAVKARAAEIQEIRAKAATEASTRAARGDDVTLLAAQRVSIDAAGAQAAPMGAGEDAQTEVLPEEAFPAAVDAAERTMAGGLGERIGTQRAEVARLRGQVIPEHPSYKLEEFAAVHRRWFGMYSLAQEQQNTTVQTVLALMGEPYRMMGTDVGSAAVAVEGGFARALLMSLSVDLMAQELSGATTQFGEQIRAAGLRRLTSVGGTAGRMDYRFGEIYTGSGPVEAGMRGEVTSREALSAGRSAQTAAATVMLTALPAALRPAEARRQGLVTSAGDVPLVGVAPVSPQEGWTYLTDVTDPLGHLVAREQKTMSPEVVKYLLAARQQAATLAEPHVPRSGWRALGSTPTRGGGVEWAPANWEARFLHGEWAPRPPHEVTQLAGQLQAAREETQWRPKQPKTPEDLIAALQGDLHRYLDAFFAEHQDGAWRVAGIFTLANTEHGIGRDLMALLEPARLASMILEAIKVTAIMMTLQALGPLGEIAAHAYQAHLAAQGVSNTAALISVAAFCRNAADADSLDRARAWGYMSRTIAADAADLFSNLVMTATTSALHAVVDRATRPKTPQELADALQPLMQDPVSRQRLMAEVEAEIASRERGAANRSDPELEALRGFRDSLLGVTRVETAAAAESPLAGRGEAGMKAAEHMLTRPARSEADRAALRSALPPDLAKVQIVELPEDGNAVRVRYGDEGGLRIELGRDAGPEHVRRHVETVLELRRYEGPLGRVRQLLSRAWQALTGHPAYGTKGFEARLEVRKLNAILGELYARQVSIDARAKRLMAAESPDIAHERQAVDRDIAGIERQLDLFQRNLDSYEAGRGFVAAESTLRAGGGSTGLPLRESATMARADQRIRSIETMLERNPRLRDRFAGLTRALRIDYSRQRDVFLDLSPDSPARSGGMSALAASERALQIERQAVDLLSAVSSEASQPAGSRTAFDATGFYARIRTLPTGERISAIELAAGDVAASHQMQYDTTLSTVNNRSVYRHPNGELYAVDTQHGSFERCAASGKHLEEVRFDLTHLDDADKTGGHDLKVP